MSGFWGIAVAGRLELQCCTACGRHRAMPSPICAGCLSDSAAPCPASGHGHVYAVTEIHRAPNARLGQEAPYLVALVELEEGPRVMARLAEKTPIGAAVRFAGTGDSGAGPWLRFRPLANDPLANDPLADDPLANDGAA